MLIEASVGALPDRPREGFLFAIDVFRVAALELQEFALLHRRPAAHENGGVHWVQVWGDVLGAAGRYEAVVRLPTQPGDRLRLQAWPHVLREWTIDW